MRRIAALCWFGAAAAVPLYGAQIWARGARAFLCFFYFLCGRAASRPQPKIWQAPAASKGMGGQPAPPQSMRKPTRQSTSFNLPCL